MSAKHEGLCPGQVVIGFKRQAQAAAMSAEEFWEAPKIWKALEALQGPEDLEGPGGPGGPGRLKAPLPLDDRRPAALRRVYSVRFSG